MDSIKALDFSDLYNAKTENIQSLVNGVKNQDTEEGDGELFSSILNSAISNLKTTNDYLTGAQEAEISFALGENENTHDLAIAIQKASTALQYTVAVRDKMLEAYNTIMQIQI